MLYGEHAVVYGSPCIVTAVDQRVRVSVEPNGEGEIHVLFAKCRVDEYHKSVAKLDKTMYPSRSFVEHLVKRVYKNIILTRGLGFRPSRTFLLSLDLGPRRQLWWR